jgi:hypothetical protein
MLKSKSRLWNAVRSLRGKRGKLLDNTQVTQDDSDSPSVEVEELEPESELERQVKQWLSESFPPQNIGSPASFDVHRDQDHRVQGKYRLQIAAGPEENESAMVLYHPDFADWASIHPSQCTMASSSEENGPDDLIQVLDGATASLSKLLSAPFCTFG